VRSRLQWANHNAASFGFLFLLFVGCAFFHFVAHFDMGMASGHLLVFDARAIYEMKVIDFIEAHLWIALAYFGATLLTFIWLTIRMVPRWMFRISSAAYALPCIVYFLMCRHIADKLIDWSSVPR
jgi:hypothetical protein